MAELLPPLFELLSGLLTLAALADDSGFEGPLEEQANGFEVFSDPETGDVEGAEDEDASPVTETFLLNLSITADKDPFVLLGVARPEVEPAVAEAATDVQLELAEEACCCFVLDIGEEEIDDEAAALDGKTKVEEDETGGELLPLELAEKETPEPALSIELAIIDDAPLPLSELEDET